MVWRVLISHQTYKKSLLSLKIIALIVRNKVYVMGTDISPDIVLVLKVFVINDKLNELEVSSLEIV